MDFQVHTDVAPAVVDVAPTIRETLVTAKI